MLRAVELFSGGGGLAVGLKRAGITPLVAVENEKHAAATFRLNHPGVAVIEHDVRRVSGKVVRRLAKQQNIDILAACPPCQGFSSLTSKYRREDSRNELVLDVARLCTELQPTAIMLENVPGLAKKGRALLEQLIATLEGLNYVVNWDILQVADFGVPQKRKRLVLLAGRHFRIDLPEPTHDRLARSGLPRWRTVRQAIEHLPAPIDLQSLKISSAGFEAVNWHVTRSITERNRERLATAIPGASWSTLPESLRAPCHQNGYIGFTNAYGKLAWDEPSGTITAGCTTPSKGRFGHPEEPRALSLREAALLQTFPPDYKFGTPFYDRACDIVGNALPSQFAELIAAQVAKTIKSVRPWLDDVTE